MKSISTSILFVAAGFVLAACSGASDDNSTLFDQPSGSAIVHGRSDSGDPGVVAIDIGGEALCSGSLIAPRWVLTARHCVSETTESVACPPQGRQITGDRDPQSLTILVGHDARTATPVAVGQRLLVPQSSVLCSEDIALIELDRDVTTVKPLAVAQGDEPAVGDKLRAVGFGKRGDNVGAGLKYARSGVRVLSVSPSEFEVGESTCNGDSGGPALDASGAVVGVVSRGGPGCEGPDAHNIYTRTSAFASLLNQALGGSGRACSRAHHCPRGYHCSAAAHVCMPAS